MVADPADLAVAFPSSGRADLTWSPSSDPGLLDYSVFRRTPSTGAAFTPGVDTPVASGITDESYSDTGLAPASYDWQVFGRLFSPADIATLHSWFDASVPSSITGSPVSQWSDLSGNGNHITQASGSQKPTTGVHTMNGRNVLTFSQAANTLLARGSVTIAQPLTVFAVAKLTTGLANTQILGNLTNPEATLFAFDSGGGGKWSLYAGSVQQGSIATTLNAVQVSAVFNGASSGLWVDGATSTLGGSPGAAGRTDLEIGDANSWEGDIAEVLIYSSALSTPNRQAVEAYLKAKWGTP